MEKQVILYDLSCANDLDVENEVLKKRGLQDKYELVKLPLDSEAFLKCAATADAACIYTPLTEDRLSQFPNAKVIAIPAVGADHAHKDAADKAGICICNAPTYCVEEVATHSVALILACARKIACFDRSTKKGEWNIHAGGDMHRLSEMKHGLISFGRIPREVARMMKDGFHVSVKAYDPNLPDSVFEEAGVERASTMEELFATCDIVSVHTPLFPDTYHMVGKKQFDAIQKPIIFVVTSRGGVVVEPDLKAAIEAGKVEVAGIDVVEDEQNFKSILTDMPEVTQTPHVAYYSVESDRSLREINISDIIEVLEDRRLPQDTINKELGANARFLT